MRSPLLLVCSVAAVLAQSPERSATRNSDGSMLISSKTGDTAITEKRIPSPNGGSVPVERVEERVISRSPDGSAAVVERIVRKFDQDGRPTTPERIRIEERKNADGSRLTTRSVYRGDLNGVSGLAERSVSEVRRSGSVTTESVTVERPSPNGGFGVAERQSSTTREGPGGATDREITVYRPDSNGSLREAVKERVEIRRESGATVENRASYELGPAGGFQLTNQTIARTSKRADGSEVTEVDLLTTTVPGRTTEPNARPQLRERQYVERAPGPGETVRTTVSVQRPELGDTRRLAGRPQVISESVCQGKCDKP